MLKLIGAFVVGTVLVGCAGKVEYLRPNADSWTRVNVRTVDKPRDEVWAKAVPELGKRFFTINNLDKASGLINVSYSGDPERYIDCGQINSFVKNARGERTYQFPAARARQRYEVMDQALYLIDRSMALEGRVNLIFEEIGPTQTRITANTRYVLTRQSTVQSAGGGVPQSFSDTVTLNSGGAASFAPNAKGETLDCVPTGRLESEVLAAAQ